ncbi:MAG: O-antigen ligase family protein [Pseudorhodoplanes sp.]
MYYDWQFADVIAADFALLFFLGVVVVPCLAGIAVGSETFSDALFAKTVFAIGLLVVLGCLASYILGLGFNPWAKMHGTTTRLGFEALNPISVGTAAGVVIICGSYLLVELRQGKAAKLAVCVGLGLACLLMLTANSRGPVIACALALALFFLARIKRAAYIIPLLLILPFFVSTEDVLIANLLERFEGVSEIDVSIAGRLLAQKRAIDAFIENPLLGAHYVNPQLGPGLHPHNIVIESAMALGIFGLLLLFAMLIRAAMNVLSGFNSAHPLLVMLLVQQTVLANTSGALWASDAFFLLLGIVLGAVPAKRRRPQPSTRRHHDRSFIGADVSATADLNTRRVGL